MDQKVVSNIAKALKCNPEDVRAIGDGVATVVTHSDAFKVTINAAGKIERLDSQANTDEVPAAVQAA